MQCRFFFPFFQLASSLIFFLSPSRRTRLSIDSFTEYVPVYRLHACYSLFPSGSHYTVVLSYLIDSLLYRIGVYSPGIHRLIPIPHIILRCRLHFIHSCYYFCIYGTLSILSISRSIRLLSLRTYWINWSFNHSIPFSWPYYRNGTLYSLSCRLIYSSQINLQFVVNNLVVINKISTHRPHSWYTFLYFPQFKWRFM